MKDAPGQGQTLSGVVSCSWQSGARNSKPRRQHTEPAASHGAEGNPALASFLQVLDDHISAHLEQLQLMTTDLGTVQGCQGTVQGPTQRRGHYARATGQGNRTGHHQGQPARALAREPSGKPEREPAREPGNRPGHHQGQQAWAPSRIPARAPSGKPEREAARAPKRRGQPEWATGLDNLAGRMLFFSIYGTLVTPQNLFFYFNETFFLKMGRFLLFLPIIPTLLFLLILPHSIKFLLNRSPNIISLFSNVLIKTEENSKVKIKELFEKPVKVISDGGTNKSDYVYDRKNWKYSSSKARDRLNCSDSEEVDHVVALKEAFDSGAYEWPASKKKQFANDPDNQMCLDGGLNSSKSDDDLAEWDGGSCSLRKKIAKITIKVKGKYNLEIDSEEQRAINNPC